MSEPTSAELIERRLNAQYAATHARLRDDPEYVRRSIAAATEEQNDPHRWPARNRLAIYVELHMPLA